LNNNIKSKISIFLGAYDFRKKLEISKIASKKSEIIFTHTKKRVRQMSQSEGSLPEFKSEIFFKGLRESFNERIKRTDYDSWGGWVGMTWMYNYWIILIPGWMFYIVYIFSM